MPDGEEVFIMAGRGKILVVDDDPDFVEATRLLLESQSYEVVTAFNAEQAIEMVQTERPDLMLLDIMMPEGTEGFHVVWRVRNQLPEELADTPIIIVTGLHKYTQVRVYPDDSDGTYKPGEYLPVQGFMDKPVDPADLLSQVAEILHEHKLHRLAYGGRGARGR